MKNNLLLPILFLLLLPQPSHAEYFKHLGYADGLSQISVMSIYQDKLGRMWFGTKEGICIYDGHHMQTYRAYTNNHSEEGEKIIIGNDIQTIKGNREGNIFVLADFTLLKYDIREDKFQQISNKTTARSLASYNGDIWCMLNDTLYIYDETRKKLDFVLATGLEKSNCLTITEEYYYIGDKDGLHIVDRATGETTHLLTGIDIHRVFESSQKKIWIASRMEGLYQLGEDMKVVKIPYIPDSPQGIASHQIREFVEDHSGTIWFGTFDGLYKYNPQNNQFSSVKLPKSMGGLQHPSVFSLYKDFQGTIWIGSYYGGVNYFNPEIDIFVRYNYEQHADRNLYYSFIAGISEDNDHNIWIGTDGGGISCINRKTHQFTNFKANGTTGLPHNNIKSIAYDGKRNHLYIGTYLGGVSRYDIQNKQFYNYHYQQKDAVQPGNSIVKMLFRNDRLYVSTSSAIFELDPNTNTFELFISFPYSRCFDIEEEYGWIGHGRTLTRFNIQDRSQVNHIYLEKYGADFDVTKIKATKSGIYIATQGSGLFYYDKTSKKVTRYTEENGDLISNYCYNLEETNLGNILITSDKGIMLFSPTSKEFRSIPLAAGFPARAIMNGCGTLIASDNDIFIGDVEGFTSFKESDLEVPDKESNFYFSKLLVNNQEIYPADKTGILSETLPFTQELRLKYNQNNLIFDFAISNYIDLLQPDKYEYKLEGFDKEWISTRQMQVQYTNLNPGRYTLRIRSKGSNFHAGYDEIVQHIVISSPWYNTLWAWLIYFSVVSLTVIYFLRNKIIKRNLAHSLEKERFEKQQIERMNHAKLLFFTNVSHEFRTPLTLIISHIELLLQNTSIPPAIYTPIVKINKQALYMRNLVTELLDFRKFDQNHMELKVTRQDLVGFLREIYLFFLDYAQQRNIAYEFETNTPKADAWFDVRQMEKVLFNLISNAFKYTSETGQIRLKLHVGDNIVIQIIDNGTGIKATDAQYVFDRFYQGGSNQQDANISSGTGIGLALTKSIVEKHYGTISVDSEVGKGSTFTVQLQKGKEHFLTDKKVTFPDEQESQTFTTNLTMNPVEFGEPECITDNNPETPAPDSESQYTILVVEDNNDLLHVLRQLFAPHYKVVVAHNGKEGLKVIEEEKPDLIISDIMMPEMTGTEMCLQIKNSIDYCHIPVILLTALNTTEQNIEGLNRGADDYITKPFDSRILLAKCNNMIRNRLLIQQQFTRKPISEIDLTTINPLDKNLLRETARIIEENIDDPEFDIPQLCKELGMGRTLLYSKFKALTGMTPNNFILNHKLRIAAVMLKEHPEMQVAEVGYKLGFTSPIYFSRCFKAHFNTSPQGYRKEGSEDNM